MTTVTGGGARTRLEQAVERLAAAGVETPRADAEWLLAGVLGVRRFDLYLTLERALSEAERTRFAGAVARRARREPLQQIVGWEEFCGLRFTVTPAVMVPRPETELLAEWALELLADAPARPLVVDVGTGSGCLACAVAAGRRDARVIALDVSLEAARVARLNARALGLAGRVAVVVSDLFAALGGLQADLVVSNPPYLPAALVRELPPEVGEHEPRQAVDGGEDGLALIRPIVAAARPRLRPNGALALETAGPAQAREAASLLRAAGFAGVALRADLAGVTRFVAARRRA